MKSGVERAFQGVFDCSVLSSFTCTCVQRMLVFKDACVQRCLCSQDASAPPVPLRRHKRGKRHWLPSAEGRVAEACADGWGSCRMANAPCAAVAARAASVKLGLTARGHCLLATYALGVTCNAWKVRGCCRGANAINLHFYARMHVVCEFKNCCTDPGVAIMLATNFTPYIGRMCNTKHCCMGAKSYCCTCSTCFMLCTSRMCSTSNTAA